MSNPTLSNVLVSRRRWIAWLIIIACVITLIFLQRFSIRRVTRQGGAANGDNNLVSLQQNMMGRYALGMKALLGPRSSSATAALMPQLDKTATTDRQRLRSAVIAGELQGTDAALSRLAALSSAGDAGDRQASEILTKLYLGGPVGLSEAERQQLRDSLDWLAPVALTHGDPPDSAARRAALAPAKRAAIALVGFEILLFFAGLAGLVLLIVAIIVAARGRLRRAPPPLNPPHPALLETVALFLVLLIVVSLVAALLQRVIGINVSLPAMLLIPLALLWPRWRGMTWLDMRQQMGWHTGRGVIREIASGIIGYVAGLPVIGVGVLASALLVKFTGSPALHPIVFQFSHATKPHILELYLLAAVWAPLVEESVFRGAFYGDLRPRWGVAVAALVVSFFFAAVHPQGVAGIPALMSIALVLALIREWRGSLVGSMVAHGLNNFTLVSLMLMLLS